MSKNNKEETKCSHCGDMFPKDHLLDGLCMVCYSEQEEDTKLEDSL